MMIRTVFVAIALFALAQVAAYGQDPVRVSDTEATAHLLPHRDPVYPAAALAAHVTGTVILEVTIGSAGNVTRITVIDGPPMLQRASLQAVKTWRYSPFERADGKSAITYVSLPFGLVKTEAEKAIEADQAIGRQYFPLQQACREALGNHEPGRVDTCEKALEVAQQFPNQKDRQLEIWRAHTNFGQALLAAGRPDEAKAEFQAAFLLAEQRLKITDNDYASTLFLRGRAEQKLQENDEALADYAEADASMRLAIEHLPQAAKIYLPDLIQMLQQHASLLTELGRDGEAEKLLLEARSLANP